MTHMPQFHEDFDGIKHINVYSKGKTKLGRFLSNFATTPIETEDGKFLSIEGYWYWLNVDPNNRDRDKLRNLSGFGAKQMGRQLRGKDWNESEEFKRKIKAAIDIKIESYQPMKQELANTSLPLDHYYVFNGQIKRPAGGKWILEFIEEKRRQLQEAS